MVRGRGVPSNLGGAPPGGFHWGSPHSRLTCEDVLSVLTHDQGWKNPKSCPASNNEAICTKMMRCADASLIKILTTRAETHMHDYDNM